MHADDGPLDADDHPPDEPPPTEATDRDRPLCRVFAGPTSHRVQFAGSESRPATGASRNDAPAGGSTTDAPSSLDAEGPALEPESAPDADQATIAALKTHLSALELAIDAVRARLRRSTVPTAPEVRAVHRTLAAFEDALETRTAGRRVKGETEADNRERAGRDRRATLGALDRESVTEE